jgi:hypothetical protein
VAQQIAIGAQEVAGQCNIVLCLLLPQLDREGKGGQVSTSSEGGGAMTGPTTRACLVTSSIDKHSGAGEAFGSTRGIAYESFRGHLPRFSRFVN